MSADTYGGYTIEQLQAAFNKITNKTNWKKALKGVIEASEFRVTEKAAIFYAGSPLESRKLPDGRLEVWGDGYYVHIGA